MRIEIDEITAVIKAQDDIKDAAVIARNDKIGEKALYAYVVSDTEIDIDALRTKLSQKLPLYMIPSGFMQIEELYVTKNGKLDKNKLPDIEVNNTQYIPCVTETEKNVADAFSEVLGIENVGRNHNFFEYGGQSLKAANMINVLYKKCGKKIKIQDIYQNPTVCLIAEIIDKYGIENEYQSIPKIEAQEYYAASSAQKRLYAVAAMDKNSLAYNMPICIELNGELDVQRLKNAFSKVIAHHEAFRTSFVEKDGEVVQVISDDLEFVLGMLVSEKSSVEKRFNEFIKPFDLSEAPLIRASLCSISDEKNTNFLFIDIHHIICDGESISILSKDLSKYYNGEDVSTSEISYKDYAAWNNALDLESQKKFWERKMSEITYIPEIPLDYRREKTQLFKGDHISYFDDGRIYREISRLAYERGTTEFAVLMSAYMIAIHKCFGLDEIILGNPTANRTHPDLAKIIGMFSNTVIFHEKINADTTLEAFVDIILKESLDIFDNQEYPLDKIAEISNIKREASRNYLFDMLFVLQNTEKSSISFDGIDANVMRNNVMISKFDSLLNVSYDDEKYIFDFEFNTGLFKKSTINNLRNAFLNILELISAHPEYKISEVMSSEISYDCSETKKTFIQLFEDNAAKYPDKLLVSGENEITYSEMNDLTNKYASGIKAKFDEGSIIAFASDSYVEYIAYMIAVIRSGNIAVPIIASDDEFEIEDMLEAAGCQGVIINTNNEYYDAVCAAADNLDITVSESLDHASSENVSLPSNANPLMLKFIDISTGKPCVYEYTSHEICGVIDRTSSMVTYDDIVLHYSAVSEVISISEILISIGNGASLYYNEGNDELKDVITKSKATLIILNKSDFFRINKTTEALYGLKKIAVGDIIANNSLFDDIEYNGTEIYVYGSSKIACGISYTAKHKDNEFISDNLVLVRDGKMPENGSVGNCCIRHNDDLMYCGIIGRSCGNGTTAILHNEYSIRNMYQSDTGMFEIIAMENEKISDLALIGSNDQSYAFVSGDNSSIVSELCAKVPNYMLPDEICYISSIPKDIFGNVDKDYLIEYKNNEDNLQQNEMDEIQREICGIISELLKVENVMLKSDFFALGGNSLSAFKLINILEHRYGTRITLSYIFSNPDILSICKCISESADKNASEITPAEIKEKYPVSPAQKRIYLEYAIAPDSTAYNVPFAIKLHKYPDIERLDNALAKLVDNHEIIRTRFVMENDNIYQVIDEHSDIKIEICDKCYSSLDNAINDGFIRSFDLSNAPLLRMRLCKINTDEALLLFDSHHIITDGTSVVLLLKELETLYNRGEIEAQKLQYKDYSEWINSIDLAEQKKYWNEKFDSGVPALDLITDYTRNNNMSMRGGRVKHPISVKLKNAVTELANKTNTTENVIYISALGILLSRYSRQEGNIIVGSPVSGRNSIATEKMQGMFVNTIVLSLDPDRNKKIDEYIAQVKKECALCYDNQLYPYESLINDLVVSKELSRNALFDVMFVYQNLSDGKSVFDGYEAEVIEINSSDTKFDLTFGVIENVDTPYIEIEYFKDLFKQDTIEIMLQHFEQIIISMSENISSKLDTVSEVNEDEFSRLLKLSNNERTYDKNVILSERFNRIAEKFSSKTAIVQSGTKITFEELDKASNRLARRLISSGVNPGERVMVLAEKNIASFTALLAIIKIRAVFVPVIEDFSEDRIKFIAGDSQAVLFISESGNSGYILDIPEIAVISTDDKNSDSSCLSIEPHMDDELYLIYTSGTTGNPKGIIINNLNISELIFQMSDSLAPKAEESVLQFAKLVFDASVWEYIFTFAFGCTMYIPDAETIQRPELMGKLIKDAHISYALFPPVYIGYLDENDLSSMKYVITGGQATNKHLVEKYGRNGYLNLYGPTEATVMVTQWEYNPGDIVPDRIPVGRPLANVCTYIVDNERLCGFNIAGELLIGCDGISPGYVNNKELNEKQFIKNPFGKGKIYRSGDLCRMLPDGNIEYISRIDKQVKIRGFRIELAEIENAINAVEGINSSAVIVRNRGIESIFAYYTSDENISEMYVLYELKKKLPNYMIPAAVMQIERIPVNSSGKTDEKLLPEIKYTSAVYEAPEGELEIEIAAAFEEVLCIEKISVIDSFFEMGGDSIKAIRLVNALANKGIKLSVKDIFANNNVRSIAEALKRNTSNAEIHSCGDAVSDDEAIETIVSAASEKAKTYSEMMLTGGIIYEENLPSIAEISFESQIRFSYYEHIFNNVDVNVLKNAWNELCRTSEALRSTIDIDNGMQYIYQYNEGSELPVIDISEYNWESIGRIKESIFNALNIYSRPDAYNGKELMCRPIILKIGTNDYLFMLNVSHLIFDQQSQMTVAAYLDKCILGNTSLPKQHSLREFIEINKASELNEQIRNELQIEMFTSSYHEMTEFTAGKEIVPLQIVYRAKTDVDEILLMEAAEKVLYYAFNKLGCDNIPILAVSGSRNYSKASFDGVIGEFIDLIPVTMLASDGGLFQSINKSNTILKKNDIVFSSVLKSDESILGNTDFSSLMIPIFNYLGIHKDAVYNSNSIMFDNPMLYAVSSDGTNVYIGNIPVLNEHKEAAEKEIEGILTKIFG
ncbi:MAG: amino acid adenylation domain-containing protein [Ruminococcus sp.]|nr:amino acid adenylation domain-containing protein [Ruminococcus sp.]